MKSFFGIGRLRERVTAQRFEYTVTVHNLQPWPESGNRAVAVGWQRGKKKRGATRSVFAATAPGKLGNVVRFNEKFELSASLYKAPTGASTTRDGLGPFKKKCLILAVLETDGRTQATAALGRVVIDLAEFAAVDKQETRAFMVSCNKQIQNAVGDPQLLITIRSRWKKSSASVGAGAVDAGDDGNASMSTDTTGSRMTANLSSFLRFKHTGKGPANVNEEQDLGGFEPKPSNALQMQSIQESNDDEPDSPPTRHGRSTSNLKPVNHNQPMANASSAPTPTGNVPGGGGLRARYAQQALNGPTVIPSTAAAGPTLNSAGSGPRQGGQGYGVGMGAQWSGSNGNGSYAQPSGIPLSPRSTAEDGLNQQHSYTQGPAGGYTQGSGGYNQGPSGGYTQGSGGYNQGPSGVSTPQGPPRPLGLDSAGSLSFDGMQQELLLAAATEVSVHVARQAATSSRRPERAVHAAARRLARTLVCLGPQPAPLFGAHVLRLVSGAVDAAGGDLAGLAFWWSNAAALRALLASACPPPLIEALGPQIMRLERKAFDGVLGYLWEEVLLPAVSGPGQRTTSSAPSASKRALQEAATKRWFEGLRQVGSRLARLQPMRSSHSFVEPGTQWGHVAILRQQALLACLKRVDALLFHHLVAPAGTGMPDLLLDYDPSGNVWGTPARPAPTLDDASLPFSRGLLTFGSGMGIKMTVTRMQQWAAGEGGLGDGSASLGNSQLQGAAAAAGAPLQLFPLLRAAADLLMMPKELLLEGSIRRDVCQSLSVRSMLHILRSFQPDEYALDSISPDIIATLQDEQSRGGVGRPPLTDLSTPYRPVHEDQLFARVAAGVEPGLEYDADSEDELNAVSNNIGLAGANSRFKLLNDFWISHASRLRGGSVAGGSTGGSFNSHPA